MTPAHTQRVIVLAVMAGHFVAAFSALGMPPFFALILERSLHNEARYLAGWFYVVPTAFAALASPWWGRLADRYGKKRLLVRAQLGLAASFLLAGFATHTWVFFAALALQGVLGGTFAASNAYLATVVEGPALMRSLTAMQWSARAALVAAPLALGLALQGSTVSPIELYRWLALLPLTAAALAACLPAGDAPGQAHPARETAAAVEATPRQVCLLQFAFVFATVVTFPYFASFAQQQAPRLSAGAIGLLFGLPHGVYLLAALPLTRWLGRKRRLATLSLAFAALLLSLAGQSAAEGLEVLIAWRLAMGLAMTLGFIALHALIAGVVHGGNAGRRFGWFESSSKWGAVAAGISAGLAAEAFGLRAPFLLGAFGAACAVGGIACLAFRSRDGLRATASRL